MSNNMKIKNALISVFSKDGIDEIAYKLKSLGVNIYSTGGTQKYLEDLDIDVIPVESLTSYPSILGGRVKTLHPKVFGGILSRRENNEDILQLSEFEIPEIDLVIVDLYPFEDTVKSGASHQNIIEKIDIGGISLIRAAAKNYNDVTIISSKDDYNSLLYILENNNGITSLEDRENFAIKAFDISSHYDANIYSYFSKDNKTLKISEPINKALRYGENPHQKGTFYGDLSEIFTQLSGKELSYNNLLDVDAAVNLISEFQDTTFIILKHNNACGLASRGTLIDSWNDALAGDPVSAFGGILITNKEVDLETAKEINNLFYEVLIAPSFSSEALELLKTKNKRILLKQNDIELPKNQFRTILNGVLHQEKDLITDTKLIMQTATTSEPSEKQLIDLEFASKICKNTKSNTIVLVKDKQLLASGTGQTSRVDALNQAIHKAKSFNFDLKDAVMASDAFFPFPDCVEIANKAGVTAVIQPGGSIKDKLSIDYCNNNNVAMVFTGYRHFKH
jgi:phosphoribosylaminoimidazolecarboxamide formyltransferase / IMP cyclohydrolase